MKLLVFIAAVFFIPSKVVSQDLSGKWYGKITQGPGGYASEYAFELEILQKNEELSGISFAYYKEDVVAKFNYYGFFEEAGRIVLQEGLVLEKKTPPQWVVCIKRMALTYRKADSVEYLEGEWAGVGITDGEACVPGEVYLSKTPHIPQLLPENVRPPLDDTLITVALPVPEAGDSASALSGPSAESLPVPGGRSLKAGNQVTVRSPDIVVKIVDYQILDGDTVTVYFNEEKVVDRQLINKEPIILHLRVGYTAQPAKLLLYADNLGRIPPNTALMVVEDRKGRQRIKLESDYERSDVLYIWYEQ
ncbi:hypothetical protein EDD80_106227 [Anseongella ginsenosidimutans]|uniref:Uncharacterized protein n=1 Tax=Anseongella ginsenosidimutans TaxID=496056 RepID=A0A4R3KT50_9SPHI|nr:hypothetical protein [Anseongella ginsenosidimutans]QEC52344.1 hypothetical protein FRZ59_08370 [Anseongella ginsenosidimutans]TCS86911.1 hypothetical protein EDD80_106227 [Anseongella ginsenosidimutans]